LHLDGSRPLFSAGKGILDTSLFIGVLAISISFATILFSHYSSCKNRREFADKLRSTASASTLDELRREYEIMKDACQRQIIDSEKRILELEQLVAYLTQQLSTSGGKPKSATKSNPPSIKKKATIVLGIWPQSDLNIRAEMDAIYRSGLRYEVMDTDVTRGNVLATVKRVKPEILHVGAHANEKGVFLDDGITVVGWWRQVVQIHPFKLVLLNGCESLKIVEAMFDGGAMSVVGISKEIADSVAISFAKEFYRNLSSGMTVDESAFQAKLTLPHTDAEMIKSRGKWRIDHGNS